MVDGNFKLSGHYGGHAGDGKVDCVIIALKDRMTDLQRLTKTYNEM